MRAFLGIDLDPEVRGDLASLSEAVRHAAPGWAGEKWVPPDNLHLTLRFLGEIDPDMAENLVARLAAELGAGEWFVLPCLVPAEPVPGPRRARMLWTRYEDPEGRCAALAATVDDVLAEFAIGPENRPFVPHVTLVRARRPRPFMCPAEVSATSTCSSMSVRRVTLFSSVLNRSGPHYDRIAHIPLHVR
jgi:RNA 2',3'-cyclic 3'-phosphodiesterase